MNALRRTVLHFPFPLWLAGFAIAAGLLVSCTNTERLAHTQPIPVRLLTPLEFSRFTVRTNLTKADVSTLMHEKVKVGSTEDGAYLFLALPANPSANNNQPPGLPTNGQRIRVETVEQYVEALKRGASPFTTFDIAMDTWFRHTAATLLFLNQAEESRRSLLPKELPMKLLYSLPVRFLNYRGSDQEADLTLRANRHSEKLWIFNADQISVQFEFSGRRYYLAELARGDFNHDGQEDSLVAIQWHYLEGSGAGVELLLVEAAANRPLKATYFPLP
jgi:hypothetical protein